jgi:uncharacterized protein YijF (DUF1287 family)
MPAAFVVDPCSDETNTRMLKYLFCAAFLFCSIHLPGQEDFYSRLADSALTLTRMKVMYDPGYFSIPYPNGDIPADRGVCTDVLIRAYRKVGIDLQKEVHEDIRDHFQCYPNRWGLSGPDKNIDHRRVPNLMAYFGRHGEIRPLSDNPEDYQPGDVVCWDLGDGIPHIGIVSNLTNTDGKRHLIVHNIGGGQELSDCLFDFRVIGHYRYGLPTRHPIP